MQPDDVARGTRGNSVREDVISRPTPSHRLSAGQSQPGADSPSAANSIVERLLSELERRIDPKDFQHWFRDKVALRVTENRLIVGVGRQFLLNWLQKHFRRHIAEAAQAVLGESAAVCFVVDTSTVSPVFARPVSEPPVSQPTAHASMKRGQNEHNARSAQPALPAPRSVTRQTQRRFADLAHFVTVGEEDRNHLPLVAASQLSQYPGEHHNPFFLFGSTGCGKTHLLEGIYRRVRRLHPDLRVQYLTAENFTNYFTHSMRKNSAPQFRQKFRTIDVLILDDVEFLEGKVKTQQELLHTFEELVHCGRQVVLAGDRHPRLLTGLLPELASRFASGLTSRVHVPPFESRLEICRRKAEARKAHIKPEALRHLASKFQHNVRELEGAVNVLITQYEVSRRPVTVSTARRLLAEFHEAPQMPVDIPDIEQAVCEFFRVNPADLKSSKRSRSVSQPRMLAMFLIRKHTQAAYSEIGAHFGGRNHATVISAEKRVRDWLAGEHTVQVATEQWPLADVLESIEQRLAG